MKATYKIGNLSIIVEIIGKRKMINREERLIKPLSGSGETWVTLGKLIFNIK